MHTCLQIFVKLGFGGRFTKNTPISNMKIRLMGAELFHADGQADMTKLIVAFRGYCKRAQKMSENDHFRENPALTVTPSSVRYKISTWRDFRKKRRKVVGRERMAVSLPTELTRS
jgi:hypothetical protein